MAATISSGSTDLYRPQFPFPDAPAGFTWQPCVYQFDRNNLPALGGISLSPGQESSHIPLKLDDDAPFFLQAIKIQNVRVNVLLFDPWSNQLMDNYIAPTLFASELPPATVLEYGIEVPAGAVFAVRLQGR
jgi:hypothetical protein